VSVAESAVSLFIRLSKIAAEEGGPWCFFWLE